jgi:Mn-dependent DtxR family transcriptional regulator
MKSDNKNKGGINCGHKYRNASGLTPSMEDHLLAACECMRIGGGRTRHIDIAALLGCQKPSVTRSVRVLTRMGLVATGADECGKYLFLTPDGHALCERLCERRWIIAAFLESLGLSAADAAAEAHLWEHRVSEETADAMGFALSRAETPESVAAAPKPIPRQRDAYRDRENPRALRA